MDNKEEDVDRPIELKELLNELAKRPDWDGLRDFIACYKEGDQLRFQSHSSLGTLSGSFWSRYVGRRPNSITYTLVISFGMS